MKFGLSSSSNHCTMRKLFLPLILLTLLLAANAQPYRTLSTDLSVKGSMMSEERLNRIDKTVQDYIDQKWLVGAVAIVYRNGNLAYYKAFGKDDVDKNTLMQKNEIFRIASQTKAIASTAILMLYEQGKLLLDDP